MSAVRILGIDLSSQAKNTAAWTLLADGQNVVPRECIFPADDDRLNRLIEDAEVIGIDVPFGWPTPFLRAVRSLPDWPTGTWAELRDGFRLRETDRAVHAVIRQIQPLSVSSDRIALPAMRAMGLLNRWKVVDRSGLVETDGRWFVEVYPAATLHAWGLPSRGYKHVDSNRRAAAAEKRREILAGLRMRFGWGDDSIVLKAAEASDHSLDALVAGLTALLAHQGNTLRPTEEQVVAAKTEGWIHVPQQVAGL